MSKAKLVAVGIFLGLAGLSSGATYVFPLDLYEGAYAYQEQYMDFNLQSTFQSISQVRLSVTGVSTPSVWAGDGVEGPSGYYIGPGDFEFSILPNSTSVGPFGSVPCGRFSRELTLTSGQQNWDFLLDGQGTLAAMVDPGMGVGGEPVFPAFGNLFEASLIIEGTALTYTPPTRLPTVSGDLNGDGLVDVADLGILAANYGTIAKNTWTPADFDLNGDGGYGIDDISIVAANFPWPYWLPIPGDVTWDGNVDVSDLGVLAAHYGSGTPISPPIGVPEPTTLLLLAGLIPALFSRGKK